MGHFLHFNPKIQLNQKMEGGIELHSLNGMKWIFDLITRINGKELVYYCGMWEWDEEEEEGKGGL